MGDPAKMLYFLFEQKTSRLFRQVRGNPHDRSVGPMTGAKGIIDKNLAALCQLFRKLRVIVCFFFIKPDIFQQQQLALFQAGFQPVYFWSDNIGSHDDVDAGQKLAQPFGHWLETHFRVELTLRPPQMRSNHQPGTSFQQVFNSRQRGLNPCFIPDLEILIQRHIEIDPQKDDFTFGVNILQELHAALLLPYFVFMTYLMRSARRQE